MFGYVKPCIPELKVKDFEKFKAYYCGLCHSIKKLYGNFPRLCLNYDMTFLAILLDSLSEDTINYKKIICPTHPTKKKALVCSNSALEYSAHMNVSLFYYKLLDDVKDDNNLKSKALSSLMKSKVNSYTDEIGAINLEIYYELMELSRLETSKISSIDEICDPFSTLTAVVLSSYPNCSLSHEDKNHLYSLGYNLGKWIYLIDAMDDLEKDMEENKFNAINEVYNTESLPFSDFKAYIAEKINFLLVNCGSECLYNLEKLPIKKNKDLLLNIVHLGIMEQTEKLTKGVIHND